MKYMVITCVKIHFLSVKCWYFMQRVILKILIENIENCDASNHLLNNHNHIKVRANI